MKPSAGACCPPPTPTPARRWCAIRAAAAAAGSAADLDPLPIGQAEILRHGKDIALLAFGSLVPAALAAGEALDATVVNMRFIKPLDRKLLQEIAGNHSLLVSIEENTIIGGAGAEVERSLGELDEATLGCPPRFLRLGLPDDFIEHGEQGQLLAELGLDAAGIARQVRAAASL